MIRSLGIQKITLLILMALVLGSIYLYDSMILEPKTTKSERQLKSENSEFNEISDKLENLRIGLEKFEVQKDKFLNLNTLGFFDPQDRVDLTKRLDEIGVESGVLFANYTINSAGFVKNEKAEEADHQVLLTPITFRLGAILDENIYKYIYLLNYGFSGHVTIKDLVIEKTKKITPTLLQDIGTGNDVATVEARLSIELRTLIPRSDNEISATSETRRR
jgi:hypothetical protein